MTATAPKHEWKMVAGRRALILVGGLAVGLGLVSFNYGAVGRHATRGPTKAAPPNTAAQLPPGAYVLHVGHSGRNELGQIPKLDEALAIGPRDEARESEVLTSVRDALRGHPTADRVEGLCTDVFCRLRIDKQPDEQLGWREIDKLLRPVIRGQMLIQTDSEGRTGWMYFSRVDTRLPS